MNIERPGSPSATTVAPASKRRSTSIEIRRSRLASERPPKKGVATRNAFRSGELTTIDPIYHRLRLNAQRAAVGEQGRLPARVEENDVVVRLPPPCPHERDETREP